MFLELTNFARDFNHINKMQNDIASSCFVHVALSSSAAVYPILKLTSIIANFKHILQALRVAKLPQNQFGQKLQLVNILKFFVHKLEN